MKCLAKLHDSARKGLSVREAKMELNKVHQLPFGVIYIANSVSLA